MSCCPPAKPAIESETRREDRTGLPAWLSRFQVRVQRREKWRRLLAGLPSGVKRIWRSIATPAIRYAGLSVLPDWVGFDRLRHFAGSRPATKHRGLIDNGFGG